jgi:hypothetical protein
MCRTKFLKFDYHLLCSPEVLQIHTYSVDAVPASFLLQAHFEDLGAA